MFRTTAAALIVAAASISGYHRHAAASLSVLSMLLVRLPKEEEKLIERFGDEYREYMKRTGRLLPRLRDQGWA